MIEHALVHGNYYGIPRAPIEAALEAGRDVIMVIDWQGHRTLNEKLPKDVVGVFLLPPSMDELERRLRGRGDKDSDIGPRLAHAAEESAHWDEFSYVVVNEDLGTAIADVSAILAAERMASRRSGAARSLVSSMGRNVPDTAESLPLPVTSSMSGCR